MTRLALALAVLAAPATAQTLCADHATADRMLATTYGEAREGVGLDRAGRMVEVYANRDTGTFTVLVTTAEGLACIVASGEAWEPGAVKPEGEGA